MALEERELFGGAIIMNLPIDVFDISTVRDVPDHEEVFTHPTSDQSIIIEILEHTDLNDAEAPKHYFDDLAQHNQAISNDCEIKEIKKIETLNLPYCDSIWYLNGTQAISKYHETAKNLVKINLVLLRYNQFGTDILITFNDPIIINPLSSSHAATPVHSERWSIEQFNQMIATFCILDFDLFKS